MKLETRSTQAQSQQDNIITGLIPYNSKSKDMGFYEEIRSGAFKYNDVIVLYNHDKNKVLASTKNGSLELRDSSEGLHFTIKPIDTTDGTNALKLVKSGTNTGVSFGFNVIKDSWAGDIRSLEEIELKEISICVTTPAYSGAYARNLNNEGEDQMTKSNTQTENQEERDMHQEMEQRGTEGVQPLEVATEPVKIEELRTVGEKGFSEFADKKASKVSLADVIRCQVDPLSVSDEIRSEVRAMTTGGNAVLIPQILSASILDLVRNKSVYLGNIPVTPMSSGNLSVLKTTKNYDGVKVKAEGDKGIYGTEPTFGKVDLKAKTFFGLIKVTMEDLATVNLEQIIRQQLADDMSEKLDKYISDKIYSNANIKVNILDTLTPIPFMDKVEDVITDVQLLNKSVSRMNLNPTTSGIMRKARDTQGRKLEATDGYSSLAKLVSNSVTDTVVYDPSALLIGMLQNVQIDMSKEVGFEEGTIVFRVMCMLDTAVIDEQSIQVIKKKV